MTDYIDLAVRTAVWATRKGLMDDPRPLKQHDKLIEEVIELRDELIERELQGGNIQYVMGELGDVIVVVHVLAAQLGIDPMECFEMAVNKIEKRKGKMVNGTFVKDGS